MLVSSRHMKQLWFHPAGWLYRPTTWQGWLVTVLIGLFCLHIIMFVLTRAHSASDVLYAAFPYVVPSFLLWAWIASKKSS